MTLSELLESKFRGDIRFRGAAYIQAERVAVIRVTQDHLFAIVRDGVEYQTQLSRDASALKMSCDCVGTDANKSGNPHCKHLWATILAADAGNYMGGAAKQGYYPPFAVEDDPLDFGMQEWDVDDNEAYSSVGSSRSQKRAERESIRAELDAAAVPRLREWESRLSDLRKAMQGEDAANSSSASGRERQIFYEIDAPASEEAGLIIIQTSHRQRRSNGEWGKLKPLKLKPGKFEDIDDDEDRRILGHLVGGSAVRS